MLHAIKLMGFPLVLLASVAYGMCQEKFGAAYLSALTTAPKLTDMNKKTALESKPAGLTATAQPAADAKQAAEVAPAPVDPYQSAHALFATAATKEDYETVIMAYSEAQKEANENQRAIATTNKGEARLAIGDIEGGFADRDARLACPQDARLFKAGVFVTLDKPLTVASKTQGSTIAVYCDEGGIGDIYFFSRYMKVLRNNGAKVIGVATTPFVQKILNALVESGIIDSSALFTGKREKFTGVPYDYDIHMMSLPACVSSEGLTASAMSTIPKPPYLDANKQRVEFWQNKISAKQGLHIAYCFAASTQPAGVYRRLDRNIDQAQLEGAITSAASDATLYCIQGPGTKTTGEIVNIADEESRDTVPFAHTIALLEALKASKRGMFVGIDTGPTNAALAVGINGYVLLPRVADWRWGVAKTADISEDQTPSAFAPTLNILRQKEQGNWTAPLAKLKKGLTACNEQVKKAGSLGGK